MGPDPQYGEQFSAQGRATSHWEAAGDAGGGGSWD